MGTSNLMPDSTARRRSGRVASRLKVILSGTNVKSEAFEERAETIEVSKYGAKIATEQELKIGTLISLSRPDVERVAKFKVVYQQPPEAGNGRRETGIEFVGVDSFWGVQFPPEKGPWN